MKFGWLLGIGAAVFVHLVVIAFGGIFFLEDENPRGSVQAVDLLADAEDVKKDSKKEEPPETPPEELETHDETPPDSAEVLKSLDAAPINDAPALEAASLSAIEAALNGGGSGGGDFAEALSFGSGGRIGGTGKAGGSDEKIDEAFSLTEIDQKPRAIFQASPTFPAEMRGKKVEGLVSVIFVVDANGKVDNPRVEKSSHKSFETPAIAAVRKWKFEPGLRGGERVASKMRVSIRFPVS